MANEKKAEKKAEKKYVSPLSGAAMLDKARETFNELSKRATGALSPAEGVSRLGASSRHPHAAQPNPSGYPPMPFMGQIPPGGMPFPSPPMMPGAMPAPLPIPAIPGLEPQFFSNVGNMLNLGVMFAASAFAGGMQVMQGFVKGQGSCHDNRHGYGHHDNRDGCGCGGHDSCGCDSGHHGPRSGHQDHCGCNPGVHNCSC